MRNLSVVSCRRPSSCVIGSTHRPDLPPGVRQGHRARGGRAHARRRRACPTSRAPARASAPPRPNLNQVAVLNGSTWQAPGHHLGRAGHHGDRLHRAHLLHHDRRRGELVRLQRQHAGPATSGPGGRPTRSPACHRRSASPPRAGPRCSTATRGPSRATSTAQGQLNSVSCATTTFCVIVDSNGAVLTWNGVDLLRSGIDRHRAAPHRHQRVGPDRRLVSHHDLLPGRRLPRPGLRLERHGVECGHPHRQRPRAHEHLVPDGVLLRRGGPVGQRLRLRLTGVHANRSSSQSKAAVQNTIAAIPSQCPSAPSALVNNRNVLGHVSGTEEIRLPGREDGRLAAPDQPGQDTGGVTPFGQTG